MFRHFLNDRRGNFAMITGIAMVPIMGALAIAIDYDQMSSQRQDTLNALDAANIATARMYMTGASESDVKTYASKFFTANLTSVKPSNATLSVILPTNAGGTAGQIKLTAGLKYSPYFLPPFLGLLSNADPSKPLDFYAESVVQLKNTAEVALVLDNSGSMSTNGKGTGKPRLDLLKSASIQLVDQLAATASSMKGVDKPIQFSVVPFASSVNIGPTNANEPWMDTLGISPIHHENFDWTQMAAVNANKAVTKDSAGVFRKQGTGWPVAERNEVMSRFTLYKDMKRLGLKYTDWQGCVETRPWPYDVDDTAASTSNPSTLFVPQFAPDETDRTTTSGRNTLNSYNSWWLDKDTSTDDKKRQRYTPKYYDAGLSTTSFIDGDVGPNQSCTTAALTPLTDVTTTAGLKTVKDGINSMIASGATNVTEGMMWGWRTLSSAAPFTGGRAEAERGNDKVLIVLTDGANTYYDPTTLGNPKGGNTHDLGGNESIYSAYGYAYLNAQGKNGRIFDGTSSAVSKTTYTIDNYSLAMNEHFSKACVNGNGGDTGGTGAGLIIMTVALDLDMTDKLDKAQATLLESCASRSRYTRDPNNAALGKKLFWNATGSNLSDVFKAIADELTNMRIIG